MRARTSTRTGLNVFQRLALVSQFFTVFGSLMFIVSKSMEMDSDVELDGERVDSFAELMVAYMIMFLNAAAAALYPAYRLYAAWTEHAEFDLESLNLAISGFLGHCFGKEIADSLMGIKVVAGVTEFAGDGAEAAQIAMTARDATIQANGIRNEFSSSAAFSLNEEAAESENSAALVEEEELADENANGEHGDEIEEAGANVIGSRGNDLLSGAALAQKIGQGYSGGLKYQASGGELLDGGDSAVASAADASAFLPAAVAAGAMISAGAAGAAVSAHSRGAAGARRARGAGSSHEHDANGGTRLRGIETPVRDWDFMAAKDVEIAELRKSVARLREKCTETDAKEAEAKAKDREIARLKARLMYRPEVSEPPAQPLASGQLGFVGTATETSRAGGGAAIAVNARGEDDQGDAKGDLSGDSKAASGSNGDAKAASGSSSSGDASAAQGAAKARKSRSRLKNVRQELAETMEEISKLEMELGQIKEVATDVQHTTGANLSQAQPSTAEDGAQGDGTR